LLKVPQVEPLQPEPDRLHVTPELVGSFVTVALKFCVALTTTEAVLGETDAVIGGAVVIVIVAEAVLVPSVAEVAVRVTVAGVGTVAGAV
jgi:hypothetical protein